jgi:hypothetical protein
LRFEKCKLQIESRLGSKSQTASDRLSAFFSFRFSVFNFQSFVAVLLLPLPLVCSVARAKSGPEITSIRAGFAGRYKVGLWTPLNVTVRGGDSAADIRVRATLADSDGLNCTFQAEPCRIPAGQETVVPLCVRFGRESGSLALELLGGETVLATKTVNTAQSPSAAQIPDALGPGRRLVVSVGAARDNMENALPNSEGKFPRNVIAAVENLTDLPTRWQGYEGADFVVLSTSRREVLAQIAAQPARIEALDQWVRAGGTLVLCAGENGAEALGKTSPLARFVPGQFEGIAHLNKEQVRGWETYANGPNPIPKSGGKVDLPTARLARVQGRAEAWAGEIPLVVRTARGLGEVIFVATDLDGSSMRAWSDRPLLMAAILGLPATEPPPEPASAVESYGYDDLAGQLRSSLEQFRGVRLVPFFVVVTLAAVYILLIGPGDYFLLRRLRRGMGWTWITFPAVVALFVAAGPWASTWLKRGVTRVNQVDLIDIAADGTVRGTSWFSIFSPRPETSDLSLRPSLPDGGTPNETGAALAWFGKAGAGFNGMYNREMQNAGPLGGEGYTIAADLDAARDVPIQVWSCKNFVYRWLGRAADQGLDIDLQEENRQPAGTIANHLTRGGKGVTLSHAYLAYDGWAYLLGTLRAGETVEVNSATRRVKLNTFMSSESLEDAAGLGGQAEKTPYDAGSRDAAYALRAMLFYDSAAGRKRTGMANDYQGYTDLSGVFHTGRAVLVAMPPQEEAFHGAELLRGPVPQAGETDTMRPLAGPLDRHTIVYRFIAPVGKGREQ